MAKPPNGQGSPDAILRAWASVAWDSNRNQLIVWGGGHQNYANNDVYLWNGETGQWQRGSLPSAIEQPNVAGLAANYWQTVDGPLVTPISAHTYDNNGYLPNADRFFTPGGAAFNTGAPFQRLDSNNVLVNTGPYLWDPSLADPDKVGGLAGSQVDPTQFPDVQAGNMWQNRDRLVGNGTPVDFRNGGTVVRDENGADVVYIVDRTSRLYRYAITDVTDPATDTISEIGSPPLDSVKLQGPLALDTDLFVKISGCYQSQQNCTNAPSTFVYWPLSGGRGESFLPTEASGEFDFDNVGDYGMDYDPIRKRFVLWNGARENYDTSNGNNYPEGGGVWSLTPPDQLGTAGWTIQRIDVDISSGSEPDRIFRFTNDGRERGFTGIMGKWLYISEYDAFVGIVQNIDGEVWAYKPDNWQPEFDTGNGGGGNGETPVFEGGFES